jgi:hypothetical protein
MIYSPDNNFLLIKNFKVGGTSLEIALSYLLPENAICTPIDFSNAYHAERNWKTDKYELSNHTSYGHAKTVFGEEVINNTVSAVFVRNPYEQVLSWFFHRLNEYNWKFNWNSLSKEQQDLWVEKFFSETDPHFCMLKSTKKLYTQGDENLVSVGHVLRYENGLENEINKVLSLIDLPAITIPYKEKNFRPEEVNYLDIFKEEHLKKIQTEWSWEFETFNYQK